MSLLNPVNKSFCLEQLCASNYQKLFKLIPNLLTIREGAIGYSAHHSPLHLTILDQSPYTMTIELSHCFMTDTDNLLEPAVIIRIYQDVKLAEVLSDHVRLSVTQVFRDLSLSTEIMNYKWRLNYFLQKWLNHCLNQHYQFNANAVSVATDALA